MIVKGMASLAWMVPWRRPLSLGGLEESTGIHSDKKISKEVKKTVKGGPNIASNEQHKSEVLQQNSIAFGLAENLLQATHTQHREKTT